MSTVLKVQKLGTNDYQQNQKNRPSLVLSLKDGLVGKEKTYFQLTGWIRMEGKISILEHLGELIFTCTAILFT